MMMEYIKGGTLLQHLNDNGNKISEADAQKVM